MDTKELLGGNAKSNVAFPALTNDSSTHNGLSVKDASVICNTLSGDSGHIEPSRTYDLTTFRPRLAQDLSQTVIADLLFSLKGYQIISEVSNPVLHGAFVFLVDRLKDRTPRRHV